MAASTSAVSLSNIFHTPLPSSQPSSSSFKNVLIRCHLKNKPLSITRPAAISNGKRIRASSDPLQQSSPNSIDESINEYVAAQTNSSKLMSILQVYKEAVLIGDVMTTSQIEALLCKLDKDKNQLAHKVSAMSVDINSGKEKYIRLQADFDNFRKRTQKERLTVTKNAKGEVIQSLLPMVDNFDRARQQLKLETEREKSINASYQGIYKQLVEIMKNLQVTVVPTVGKPFDPSIHESIAREESQEFKEGIIIQEVCRGFLLGERLLRPATVIVSSGPGKRKGAPTIKSNSLGQSAAASS